MAWKRILQHSKLSYLLLSFSNLSQVIYHVSKKNRHGQYCLIHHDNIKIGSLNRNAAPLSVLCGRTALIFNDDLSFLAGQVLLAMKETKLTKVTLLMEVQGTIR